MSVLSFLIPKDVSFGLSGKIDGLFAQRQTTKTSGDKLADKLYSDFKAVKQQTTSASHTHHDSHDFAKFDLAGAGHSGIKFSGNVDHEGGVRPANNVISAAISDAIRIGKDDSGITA